MKLRHLAGAAALLGTAVLVASAWAWLGAGSGSCSDTVLREVPSPSGRLKAVLFERDCGSTTGFNRHMQILRPSESLQDNSPFAIDDDHGSSTLDVHMRWDGDAHLIVSRGAQARVFHEDTQVRGVAVAYEALR
jgi:hypothetical protein